LSRPARGAHGRTLVRALSRRRCSASAERSRTMRAVLEGYASNIIELPWHASSATAAMAMEPAAGGSGCGAEQPTPSKRDMKSGGKDMDLCRCGKGVAACGACGRGWAQEPPAACPSALSQYLGTMQDIPSIEARANACLADLADSALRSLHEVSEQYRPRNAGALAEGAAAGDRLETLAWLVQAFEVMQFSDPCLFDTAMLLDRYYSSPPREETRDGGSQRKLLAAVCLALKVGSAEDLKFPLRQVVTHLGRDRVPFAEVLEAEMVMLRKLRFCVSTPTVHDFLDGLSTRLQPWNIKCTILADFLLQLSLVDAHLLYRYPHSVLAAAALAMALYALRAGPALYQVLFEDLQLHCPEGQDSLEDQVLPCCRDLHVLWVQGVGPHRVPIQTYTQHVCNKFAKNTPRDAVSTMMPPVIAPLLLPPRMDIQDAMSIVCQSAVLCASGEAERMPAQDSSMCLRCGRAMHKGRDGAVACLECGPVVGNAWELRERQHGERYDAAVGARLRSLAESSPKIQSIFARHGWSAGHFRLAPDRRHLLRDLELEGSMPAVVWSPISKTSTSPGSISNSSCGSSSSSSFGSLASGSGSGSSAPAATRHGASINRTLNFSAPSRGAAAVHLAAEQTQAQLAPSISRAAARAATPTRVATATGPGARDAQRRSRSSSLAGTRSASSLRFNTASGRSASGTRRTGIRSP